MPFASAQPGFQHGFRKLRRMSGENDVTLTVDEEAARDGRDSVAPRHWGFPVAAAEENRKRVSPGGEVVELLLTPALNVDSNDLKPAGLIPAMQLLEGGHRPPAGSAPGGPEIQQDQPAPKV